MSEENGCEAMETIDEIVREMRIIGGIEEKSTDQIHSSFQSHGLRMFADRIEAAAKREREAGAEASQICGEIGEMVGRDAACHQPVTDCHGLNAAAMREALSDACYAMFNFLKTQNGGYEEMSNALDKAKAALAKPPRNCDVGTAEEKFNRFDRWCNSMVIKNCCGVDCRKCFIAWWQMPYDEGGAK